MLVVLGGGASCDRGGHRPHNHPSNHPNLDQETYPDINTVPFGEHATASRTWHGKMSEDQARQLDHETLVDARTVLSQQGDTLRAEAGLAPREVRS